MKRKINQETIIKLVEPVLNAGNLLSNIAYNIKQRDDVPSDVKESCKTYQLKWDEVRNNLPKWIYERKN